VEGGLTSIGQVIEQVAVLHRQGRYASQDALDESAAVRAVSSKAGLSPHHRVTNATL